MASSDLSRRVVSFAAQEGWTTEETLDAVLDYVGYQADDEALMDHLSTVAAEQDGGDTDE